MAARSLIKRRRRKAGEQVRSCGDFREADAGRRVELGESLGRRARRFVDDARGRGIPVDLCDRDTRALHLLGGRGTGDQQRKANENGTFQSASLALPVSQGLTSRAEVKGIELRHTRAAFRCRVRRNVQPACPRREMMEMTVREADLTAASSADREPEMIESGGTARLHLTLATTDYDHVRDLVNGVIRPEGIMLTAFVLPVEEVFYRFIKNREWDISEMSFGKFIGFASQGNSPFVGIPVFPSRVFRHSAFYVRADRGIAHAEGSRRQARRHSGMGADCRHLCARLPCGNSRRRLTQDSMGAGRHERGRAGRRRSSSSFRPEFNMSSGATPAFPRMLLSGEIDAAISARVPDAFRKRRRQDRAALSRNTAPRKRAITRRPAFSRSCT